MKISSLIASLVRYKPLLYIQVLVVWAMVFAIPLLLGVIIQRFFDTLTNSIEFNAVVSLILLFLLAYVFRMFILFIGFYVDYTFTFNISALLRKNMIAELMKKPGAESLKESSGGTITRFREDVDEVAGFVAWTADLIYKPILILIALAVMFNINVTLTFVSLIPVIGVILGANSARNLLEKYRKASRESTGMVTSFLGEIFNSVQVIKMAGAEKQLLGHLKELNEKRRNSMVKDRFITEVLEFIFGNATTLGNGLIVLVGAPFLVNRSLSVGEFILFMFYLEILTELSHFIGRGMARYKQCGVAFKRLNFLFKEKNGLKLVEHNENHLVGDLPEITNIVKSENDRLEELTVKNLSYSFPNSGKGIKNISLNIKRGSFVVITGKMGSGKTTLLKSLTGLLQKDKGIVYWNGKPVNDLGEFFIPPRVAYTGQTPMLFNTSIKNNLLLGQNKSDAEIQSAVKSAVFEKDLSLIDEGLEYEIGSNGMMLSGGQQQRLSTARMFLHDAELLVFDDISSSLDLNTEKILWERLSEKENCTCLVVSNRPEAFKRADHIIVLNDGEIEAEGTLNDLLNSSKEIQYLFQNNSASEEKELDLVTESISQI